MINTPFHAYYTARKLANLSKDSLIPAFASSDISIYPYQIAAATFALRSPYLKGCILCDEGSLGKTYEALLVATQKWYEGKTRQLIILPINLIQQWIDKIEKSFTLSYIVLDSNEKFQQSQTKNPFDIDAVVITTYDFAVEKAEYLQYLQWDLIILDEADCLNKAYLDNNKTTTVLKKSLNGFKLLLTPTPIEMDIRDIYGLIYFIDETVLPNIDEFYKRYFRKPENYGELTEWVSKFCFRTLKNQVTDYVNFSHRIPYTISCGFTEEERKIYELLHEYLNKPLKLAYPKMEQYDLTLQHTHILSSSPQAYVNTLNRAIERLESLHFSGEMQKHLEAEIIELNKIKTQCQKVAISGKSQILLELLQKCFLRLKQLKAPQKAIIFVDNITTLKFLVALFAEKKYKVLSYSGINSRDYSIMEQFRNNKDIQILVTTGEAAKGLDIEFCPVVVNYDMLSNATELEQRISRCHRQGQKADVIVINLFYKENYADVRYMELINKRVLQFGGIFGLSDDILGNFNLAINEVFSQLRHTTEVATNFQSNLEQHESENRETVQNAEDILFTTFTKKIADNVAVKPQYLEDKIIEINEDLWQVVKFYFIMRNKAEKDCTFSINEEDKTITAANYNELPCLFYYWTGSQNRPYQALATYGMQKDFKPRNGRITISSTLARGIFYNIACADAGTIIVDADIEPCKIGFYVVSISSREGTIEYNILTGRTETGAVLDNNACQKLFALPVLDFTESGTIKEYWLRNSTGSGGHHELDYQIAVEKLKESAIETAAPAKAEKISLMKLKTAHAKGKLDREIDHLKGEIAEIQQKAENTAIRLERIKIEKIIKTLQRDLRDKEENRFLNGMRLDLELEKEIAEMQNQTNITCNLYRQFVVEFRGV